MLILGIFAAVFGSLAFLYWLVDRSLSAPRYHGPVTGHFNGKRFRNLDPPARKGFLGFVGWQLTSKKGEWTRWTGSQPCAAPPTRVNGNDLRVTFINHATVLIQTNGLNILTDPIWSERASPVSWAGPKRHRPPGVTLKDLPPIDVVLISHNHYDHLDIETLVRLRSQCQPRIVTGLGNCGFLNSHNITEVEELDWWEDVRISESVTATCVPAKHFSGRGLSDGDATLWCGFVIQALSGNVYFAGDTARGSHFGDLKKRFKSFRLVLLPIGAYLPRWFMHPVHLSPSEAVEVHRLLQPTASMAMHFGTFALGDDGEFEPVRELRAALSNSGITDAGFWVLEQGEGKYLP